MAGSALAFIINWCGLTPWLNEGARALVVETAHTPKPAAKVAATVNKLIFAHLSSPHLAPPHHAVSSTGSSMPAYSFERCDGHHEKVDLKLRKNNPRSLAQNDGQHGILSGLDALALRTVGRERQPRKRSADLPLRTSARHPWARGGWRWRLNRPLFLLFLQQ